MWIYELMPRGQIRYVQLFCRLFLEFFFGKLSFVFLRFSCDFFERFRKFTVRSYELLLYQTRILSA